MAKYDDTYLTSANKKLADLLALIAAYYTISNAKNKSPDNKDIYKARVYTQASQNIADHKKLITSINDVEDIPGIGESISLDIQEYLETGKIQRLEKLKSRFGKEKQIMDHFTSYYGIGPNFALKLYQQGYKSIEEVINDDQLNQAQKLALIWHQDINKKIPRKEMDMINRHIGELLDPKGIKWEMVGSYRRKEPYSKDVDILVIGSKNVNMNKVLSALNSILVADLSSGEKFYKGILQLPNVNNQSEPQFAGHRVDIRIISPKSFPFGLMHFTGSTRFNILMREQSHNFGLSLSEYGFEILSPTKKRGLPVEERKYVKIPVVNSERDIFDALHVRYLKPEQRTKNLESLPIY